MRSREVIGSSLHVKLNVILASFSYATNSEIQKERTCKRVPIKARAVNVPINLRFSTCLSAATTFVLTYLWIYNQYKWDSVYVGDHIYATCYAQCDLYKLKKKQIERLQWPLRKCFARTLPRKLRACCFICLRLITPNQLDSLFIWDILFDFFNLRSFDVTI